MRERTGIGSPNPVDEVSSETAAKEARFASLFGKGSGPLVLADILDQLGFFRPIATDDELVRHNYAVELLKWCKVITGDGGNVRRLTMSLLKTERNG